MKYTFLCIAAFLGSTVVAADEKPKELDAAKVRHDRCRAYFYYTAALAKDDNKARMKLLAKAIELDSRLFRAYYNRGVLFVGSGDLDRAKADFEKTIDLKKDYIYAHYNLACVHGLASRPDEALKSLENALAIGYRKFEKIAKDPDLKILKGQPALLKLITKYQQLAQANDLSVVQRFQTSLLDDRGRILVGELRSPGKKAGAIAQWAIYEPNHEIRTLAMQLWRRLDANESKITLLRGLYDANGYVRKAAANALVSYGKDVETLVAPALEDKELGVAFYAMQILAQINARGSTKKLVPFLQDDDPKMRIMAAESLARLRAVSVLPKIEGALKNLPKDKREHDFYRTSFRRAIAFIKQNKDKPDK